MLNNKTKRNIWLVLYIAAWAVFVDRCMRIGQGEIEWWQLLPVVVIIFFCQRYYHCYRNRVRQGNL